MGKTKEDKDRKEARFTVLMTLEEKFDFFKVCEDRGVKPSEVTRAFCAEYSRG